MRNRAGERKKRSNWTLDQDQKAACRTNAKVTVVWAPPGGGKTRTAIERIAWVIRDRKLKPQRVGFLTFTNRAAREGLERLKEANLASKRVRVQTLHGFANFLIRKYRRAAGIPNYRILSQESSEQMVKRLVGKTRLPTPTDLLAIRSFAINSETSIREAVLNRFPAWTNLVPAIEQVLSDYDSRKAARKSFDFDDLLVWALKVGNWLIDRKPPFKFSHLIIDEAQDISRIQLNLIHKLYQAGGGKLQLFFVGDPNQSIFGFRGAFPDVFVKISHLWPMTKFITLTGSYRSNQGILDLASAIEEPLCKKRTRPLVARQQAESQKPTFQVFADEIAEVNGLFEAIQAKIDAGVPLADQAILFRAASDISLIRQQANYAKIPIRIIGGAPGSRRFGLMWFKALLITATERPSRADLATLFKPFSKRPKSQAKALLQTDPTTRAALLVQTKKALPPKGGRALCSLIKAVTAKSRSIPDRARAARKIVGPFFKVLDPGRASGWLAEIRDLDLRSARSIQLVIDTIDLQTADPVEPEDRLVLSSIHSAKGREWKVVYLPGLIAGKLPTHHAKSLADFEEERRVLFVAVTRAEDVLYLSMANRGKIGRWKNLSRSRFFDASVLAMVNRVAVKAANLSRRGPN